MLPCLYEVNKKQIYDIFIISRDIAMGKSLMDTCMYNVLLDY